MTNIKLNYEYMLIMIETIQLCVNRNTRNHLNCGKININTESIKLQTNERWLV